MLPFSMQVRMGIPITEQIIFAVKKAIVSGQLRAGDKFPSVRQLSIELKINPNTAHKAIASLSDSGLLVSAPGIGCFVAIPEEGSPKDRAKLLGNELEQIVVEAKKLKLSLEDVMSALEEHWKQLQQGESRSPIHNHEIHH